jgi:hypothetical protein
MTMAVSLVIAFLFFQIVNDFNDVELVTVQSTFGAHLMSLLANVFTTAHQAFWLSQPNNLFFCENTKRTTSTR